MGEEQKHQFQPKHIEELPVVGRFQISCLSITVLRKHLCSCSQNPEPLVAAGLINLSRSMHCSFSMSKQLRVSHLD